MRILVTGAAGFIGFHLVNRLAKECYEIVGIDNINNYYDVELKYARLKETGIEDVSEKSKVKSPSGLGPAVTSKKYENYSFIKLDLVDNKEILELFEKEKFDYVINLAAQAGIRYSLENPQSYIDSNITGFLNILEACRHYPVKHLVFASSSSVYGANKKIPFSENDCTDSPISLYGATKKSNELMAHTYNHLFSIPITGLRFFTVYGPWGRPDMAYYLFTKEIYEGKPIKVFNNGKMKRDFTYIDDVIPAVKDLLFKPSKVFSVYNIGHSKPVELNYFITTLEEKIGKKAVKEFLPMQMGDLEETFAETKRINTVTSFKAAIELSEGLENFVDWYKNYFHKC